MAFLCRSNTDWHFFDKVVLGNGTELVGFSIDAFAWQQQNKVPLLYGKGATSTCEELDAHGPIASILKSQADNDDAPLVSRFSSRGPNPRAPVILKPDITAPGVEILAAFSPVALLTQSNLDKRSSNYGIMSGTSMACPHVAGAATYVKSMHPNWSPMEIKSALMATAWPMNASKNTDA